MTFTEEEIYKISKEAAMEIVSCFNISIPRGVYYMNDITETVRIIISEQIIHKGNARNIRNESA